MPVIVKPVKNLAAAVRKSSKDANAAKAKKQKSNIEVAAVIKGINDTFKRKDIAYTLSERDEDPVPRWIPNPCWPLDWLYSNMRGIPCGRGSIVWGPEGSGKSAISDFVMRCFDVAGGLNIKFDFDGSNDPSYLRNLGMDPDRVILPEVVTLEEGVDAMHSAIIAMYGEARMARSKQSKEDKIEERVSMTPLNVVIDSVAAAPSKALMEEKSSESKHTAKTASTLSEQLKKIRGLMRNRPVHLMIINEQRDQFNTGGFSGFRGPTTKMPHGYALRHYGTTTLKTVVVDRDTCEVRGVPIMRGLHILVTAKKARLGVNERKAKVYLSLSKTSGGIKVPESNLLFLKEMNLLSPAGKAGVSIKDMRDLVGVFKKAEFGDVLKEHRKALRKMLRERLCSDPLDSVESGESAESED